MRSRLRMGVRTMVLATLTVTAGCGGEEEGSVSRAAELRGAALVAGSALERRGLLVLPRAGGVPHLRSLASPSDSLWSGRTELPATAEVHPLEGGVLVLREPDGTVRRYDPERERLLEVGSVDGSAVWSSSADAGLFAEIGGTRLLEIGAAGEWSYRAPGPLLWAAPRGGAGGGAVVLVRGPDDAGAPTLHVLGRDGETAGSRPAPGATPALVTGWGRRLVLTGRPPREIVVLDLPGLEEVERFGLEGTVTALAVSASTHEIYVALGDPGEVVALNRFSGGSRELASVAGPREIRPAPLGGPLLVRSGDGVWWVPLDGEARRVSTEWRPDLPRVLPDGRVLALEDGRVLVLDPASEEGAAGEAAPAFGAAADRWWIFLPWHPPVPGPVAAGGEAGGRDTAAGRGAGAGAPQPPGPAAEPDADVTEAGTGEGVPEGAAPAAGTEDAGTAGPEVPAGFYAIVASSQSSAGIRDLAGTLSDGGFPTLVQRHRDEANEVWYRVLVGPFEAREDADAAARQLRRERGLQVWIAEIGPGTRSVRFEEGGDA